MNGMRKISLIIIIFCLILASQIYSKGMYASIQVEKAFWDFGNVPFDYNLVHIYQVKNVGHGDLIISRVASNCDCTTARVADTLIPPGGSTRLRIDFRTTDYYGINTREVSIHSNDPREPVYVLEYSSDIGTIPKIFRAEPHALFFLPPEKSKKIELINDSDVEIEFKLLPEIDSVFTIDKLTGSIEPKSRIDILVTPKTDLNPGTYFSSFRIDFKANINIITTIPVKIVRY